MQWLNRIPMQFYQIFLYLLNLVSIYTSKVWVFKESFNGSFIMQKLKAVSSCKQKRFLKK